MKVASIILWYRFPHTYQVIIQHIPPALLFSRHSNAPFGGPDQDEEFVMNPTKVGEEAANEMWPLATVVIYDDYESGCTAKAFLDQVAANAGGEIQFSLTLWQMDWLAHLGTIKEVFRDLGRSVILVMALRTGGDLPKAVFDWVACWACSHAGGHSALVILGNADATAEEELRRIADRHGIRLFSRQMMQPGLDWEKYLQGLPKREEVPGPILEEIPHHPRSESYRDWGLNE